jgi:hypothetical protein
MANGEWRMAKSLLRDQRRPAAINLAHATSAEKAGDFETPSRVPGGSDMAARL